MPNSLKIGIADIIISIEGADIPTIPPAYRPFICSGKSDIRLRLHRRRPHLPAAEKIFSCSPIWHLYRHRDLSIVKIFEELDVPGSTLAFSDHLQTVDLYPSDRNRFLPNPFDGPILELLMINYLALEKGVVIHACGVEKDGLGLLFAGESGAGKSTLAQLWNEAAAGQVLSDDRTIIRQKNGQFWMHGTPWHGEAKFGLPGGVKLEHCFFLGRSQTNTLEKLGAARAVSNLLTCCFPPFWDKKGMAYTMKIFSQMVTAIPCEELRFVPDGRVVDMIQGIECMV
jgi:hypothetical protein